MQHKLLYPFVMHLCKGMQIILPLNQIDTLAFCKWKAVLHYDPKTAPIRNACSPVKKKTVVCRSTKLQYGCLRMLPVYANATQGSAQLLPSKSHKNGSVDGKLAIKRYPVYASRGAIAADATIVDGTNLLLLTRGDSGFGICHVDAFATWINFLLQLTSCQHLYVVFDNKRGSRSYPVPDIRRAFAPTYLDNRRNKIQRKHQVPISGRGPIRVDGKDRANRGSKPHSTAGAVSPTPYPLCDIAELRKSSEALMDQPPPHLAGFVHVIRQFGGLALYGLPGHEADDLIASLVAGLLVDQAGGSTHPSAMADGAAATAFTTISTGDAISSTAVATSVACRAHRVVVVSADSDMMQLLTHVGCSWLEVRQLSNSSSPQEDSPLAVRVRPLLGVSEALLRLHDAAGNAQGKSTIKNTNMQDEAEGTVVAAGAVALQARLPPAAYPDFLALVGKAEAGVPGVGVGARAAKKLLVRYRSIDGIVEAYNAGILDGSLRVIRGRSHSSGQADLGPGSSLRSAGDSSGGVGDDGNRACGVNSYPLAVRQVLQNIQVTRMLTDLTSVPWERVLDYQLQRRQKQQQQQQQQEGQEQGEQRQLEQKAHRSLLRQRQWPRPQCTESLQQMVLDAAPPPLHAHDQLHLRSAAPFIDALVAAFRRRGLTCRPVVMDEQGLLSDIVILPDHAECTDALWSGLPAGRAGLAASPAAGVAGAAGTGTLRSTASCALLFSTAAVEMIVDRLAAAMTFGQSAALPACLRTCREATSSNSPSNGNANTSCDSEDLEGDSGSGGCGSRASTGGGFTAVGDQLAAASGGPCASGMLGVEVRVPLCVCVLSPWDFKYEFQGRKLQAAQTSLQQRNADGRHYDLHQKAKQVHQQQNDQHGPPGIETCGHVAGGSPAPSIPAKLAPTTTRLDATDPGIGVTAHPGLLDFACRLRAAIGPRASPTHLSKALQTALRPTTAWRLKRLQRRAAAMSGCVAMVPFFELLEDADRVDSR